MPTTVITPTSTTTTTSQRQEQQQHQHQQQQQQSQHNGPPHFVDLHVNAGECVSLQLSDGQEQVVAGPATITMISQQQNPPVPIPVQVPPGHMIHQIADENGTLKHIILSIMDSDENAQLDSTVITLPQGTFRIDSNGELVSASAPGEPGATLTTLPQQAYIANYDGCPVAYDATTLPDSAPDIVTPAWYYYHAMMAGGNYSPKYSNYNQHVPTTLATVASSNKQPIHGGNQAPSHQQQLQQQQSMPASYRNPESDNYLQRTREVSYSQHTNNSYGPNSNVRSKHNESKRQTLGDKTSNHQQHNRYATSNVKVIDNDHLAINQSQSSNNLSSQATGSVSPLRPRVKGSPAGTNSTGPLSSNHQHQHHHHNQQNGVRLHHYNNNTTQQHDAKEVGATSNHSPNNYHGPLRQQDAINNLNHVRSPNKSIQSYEHHSAVATPKHINSNIVATAPSPVSHHNNGPTSNKGAWQQGNKFHQHKQSSGLSSDLAHTGGPVHEHAPSKHISSRARDLKESSETKDAASIEQAPLASPIDNKRELVKDTTTVDSEPQTNKVKQKIRHNSSKNHHPSTDHQNDDRQDTHHHNHHQTSSTSSTDSSSNRSSHSSASNTDSLVSQSSSKLNQTGENGNSSVSDLAAETEPTATTKPTRVKGDSRDTIEGKDVASGDHQGTDVVDKRELVKDTTTVDSEVRTTNSSSRSSSSSNSNTSNIRGKQKMCQNLAKNHHNHNHKNHHQYHNNQSATIDFQSGDHHDNQTTSTASASDFSSNKSSMAGASNGAETSRTVTSESHDKISRPPAGEKASGAAGQNHKIKAAIETATERQSKKDNHSNSQPTAKTGGSSSEPIGKKKAAANEKRRDSNVKAEQQRLKSLSSNATNSNAANAHPSNHAYHRGNTSSSHSNSNCSNSKSLSHQQPLRFSYLLRQCRAKFVVMLGKIVRNSLSSYSDTKFAGLLLVLFTIFAMLLAIFIHLYIVAPVTE